MKLSSNLLLFFFKKNWYSSCNFWRSNWRCCFIANSFRFWNCWHCGWFNSCWYTGSLFAATTSLGMTGAFASTTAVGTAIGATGGGLTAYLNSLFNPENYARLINNIIKEKDNIIIINEGVNLIIKILESRSPSEREKIREKYNKLFESENRDLDNDIENYIKDYNSKMHAKNLLKKTKDISAKTQFIKKILNNKSFEDYVGKSCFNSDSLLASFFQKTKSWTNLISSKITYSTNDISLIEGVISNKDNPLIIIRLLEHRNEEQIKFLFDIKLKGITEEEKLKKKYYFPQ